MVLDPNQLNNLECYYFGCANNQLGHYLVNTQMRDVTPSLPWQNIDTGLCRKFSKGIQQPENRVFLHQRDGWTAMAFWDRSVDVRGGSNSIFFAKGTHSVEEMWQIAEHRFPKIHGRVTAHVPIAARLTHVIEAPPPTPVVEVPKKEVKPETPEQPKPANEKPAETSHPRQKNLPETLKPNAPEKPEARPVSKKKTPPKATPPIEPPVHLPEWMSERPWYEFFTHNDLREFSAMRSGVTAAVVAGIAAVGYLALRPKLQLNSWQGRTAHQETVAQPGATLPY